MHIILKKLHACASKCVCVTNEQLYMYDGRVQMKLTADNNLGFFRVI